MVRFLIHAVTMRQAASSDPDQRYAKLLALQVGCHGGVVVSMFYNVRFQAFFPNTEVLGYVFTCYSLQQWVDLLG